MHPYLPGREREDATEDVDQGHGGLPGQFALARWTAVSNGVGESRRAWRSVSGIVDLYGIAVANRVAHSMPFCPRFNAGSTTWRMATCFLLCYPYCLRSPADGVYSIMRLPSLAYSE